MPLYHFEIIMNPHQNISVESYLLTYFSHFKENNPPMSLKFYLIRYSLNIKEHLYNNLISIEVAVHFFTLKKNFIPYLSTKTIYL